MRTTTFCYLALAALCLPLACTDGEPGTKPRSPSASASTTGKPDLRSVTDIPPYWCDLISKESLTRVSGQEQGLREVRYPENTTERRVCGVKDAARYGPLGVAWDLRDGRASLAANLRQLAADRPRPLPAGLGTGFVAYSPGTSHLPYESGALFRCGADEPWIYIALRDVSPGRNAVKDLTDLMRIAERRFGRVHRCSPGALGGG